MNILLVGSKCRFLQLLTDKLDKEGHRVFLLTAEDKSVRTSKKIFETYHFAYDNPCIREVLEGVRPDVTVFMGAYDTGFLWGKGSSTASAYTSGLFQLLMNETAGNVGRFLYLSSEEVFGGEYTQDISCEENCAAYTVRAQAIAAGEELCRSYFNMGYETIVLRLDHLYGEPLTGAEARGICARMSVEGLETGEIRVNPHNRVALLHYSDAVEFLYAVITAKKMTYGVYQISSGETISVRSAAEFVAAELEGVKVVEDTGRERMEPVLSNQRFAEEFGIRIVHKPETEIGREAAYIRQHASSFVRTQSRKKGWSRFGERSREAVRAMIPFAENLLCFLPFFLLNNWMAGSAYFQNIDFYLLYVLLFAITYGQQQATFSSILAVAGYLAVQMYQRSGFDVVLDVNTYIWIAQLLILGLVIGYMRDRLHAVEEEERHEVDFLSRQVEDISDVNGSNVRIKEILSNQIVNQNDSFGKLYEITSSLDKYEPSEVLFYAAEVLAKLMDSQDVAIYTVANHSYARLFSATSPKARMLGNSIHYVQMEELYEKLREKKVFINKTMDERYPLMADAIYSEDEMQLILMVWGIPWERMTLGQANMLTVIGYLIQNAVVRANRYLSALEQQRYIHGTRILEADAFASLVKAYLNAREKKLTECALVVFEEGEISREEAAGVLSGMMRQSDYLGELSDGKMYALLANTSAEDAGMVVERFRSAGFPCRMKEEMEL